MRFLFFIVRKEREQPSPFDSTRQSRVCVQREFMEESDKTVRAGELVADIQDEDGDGDGDGNGDCDLVSLERRRRDYQDSGWFVMLEHG